MAWSLGGVYLLVLEAAFSLGFVYCFHWNPEFAEASGFWICGIATAVTCLLAVGFEVVGFFGTSRRESPRWWHSLLRGLLYVAVVAYPVWRLYPFALAAWFGWDVDS